MKECSTTTGAVNSGVILPNSAHKLRKFERVAHVEEHLEARSRRSNWSDNSSDTDVSVPVTERMKAWTFWKASSSWSEFVIY